MCGYGVACVCVCVCLCVACLSAFVSALGSHEMGRHKLPIIIIIMIIIIIIFSDQCCELLCFVVHDFAVLRHGWITRAFPPARKNGEKKHRK